MKKMLGLLFFSFAIVAALSTGLASSQGLFIGQEHAYDVYLRGNGEALVSLRVVVNNTDTEDMRSLSLETPQGIEVSELHAVQELRKPECIDYIDNYRRGECREFKDPDYTQPSYYGSNATFKKIPVNESGGVITVELDEAITPDSNGAFLLAYVTNGFVDKAFGNAYDFTAQSLKADQRISEARMAVYADTDYRIRGAKSDVEYKSQVEGIGGLRSADSAVQNAGLQSYIQTAGQQGHVNKTAQALAPGDVMEVSGFAAQSWWRLHLKNLLISGLILALILGGIYYWWRRSSKSVNTGSTGANSKNTSSSKSALQATAPATKSRMVLLSLLLGLMSALLILAITGIVIFIDGNFQIGGYGAPAYLSVLQGLAIVCGYLFAFLSPTIFMGLRYGARWGILAAAFGFMWIIIGAIVGSILFTNTNDRTSPPIMPYHDGVLRAQ